MSDRSLLALGALSGVAYGVLETAGFMTRDHFLPYPSDPYPTGDVAARIASTPVPAGVWGGFDLEVLSTLFLIAFVVAAGAAIRRADEHSLLATASLVAGAVSIAAGSASAGIMAAQFAGAGRGLDAQGVVMLSALSWGTYFLSWSSFGMFFLCLGVGALRSRAFAAWVAWIGVGLGIAEIASGMAPGFGPAMLVQLLPEVWIPAAGIALALRRAATPQTAAATVPA
jgi:hypothetical protein